MNATCKCTNGHKFSSPVIEDSPDINYIEVEASDCPECGENFQIIEIESDDFDDVREM